MGVYVREAFKNDLQKTYGIFRVSGGIIFHMFSATHQNAFKAILGIFRHFYFFLCESVFFGGGQPTYGKFHMFFADHF